MQEVFEKIIEKLDKASDYYECEEQGGEHVQMVDLADAIEIVKQAAAEHDSGWIPCSEQLPKEDSIVWASFSNTYCDHVRKAYFGYYWNAKDGKTENCFKWENGKKMKDMPVAWKPYYVPEPYRKKADRSNCKNRHENGNCLAVGGFCTAVSDEHCQYQPKGE